MIQLFNGPKVVVNHGLDRIDSCRVSSPAMARHMAVYFNKMYPRESGYETQMIRAF